VRGKKRQEGTEAARYDPNHHRHQFRKQCPPFRDTPCPRVNCFLEVGAFVVRVQMEYYHVFSAASDGVPQDLALVHTRSEEDMARNPLPCYKLIPGEMEGWINTIPQFLSVVREGGYSVSIHTWNIFHKWGTPQGG